MKRILIILSLAFAATALAQDQTGTYDVTCEGDVVGEATVYATEDGFAADVAWNGDVQCESPYVIEALDATLHFEGDGSITVVTDAEVPEDDGSTEGETPTDGDDEIGDDEDAEKDVDPYEDDGDEKATGLDRADQVAGENGAHGRAQARAAQGLDGSGDEKDDEKEDDVDGEAEVDVDVEIEGAAEAGVGVEGKGRVGRR